MSMAYIRNAYKVPARRGGRVLINGWPGTIVGSKKHYLRVRLDGQKIARLYHPTWQVNYFTAFTSAGKTIQTIRNNHA